MWVKVLVVNCPQLTTCVLRVMGALFRWTPSLLLGTIKLLGAMKCTWKGLLLMMSAVLIALPTAPSLA